MDFVHHERLVELDRELAPRADSVRTRNPYWLTGPDGDVEGDWCGTCVDFVARHRRRHDRKRRSDYHIDGGWRTEEESQKWCGGCSVQLRVTLIGYGLREEVAHYLEYGVRPGRSDEAYLIQAFVESLSVTRDDQDEIDLALAAGDIAEAFLWSCV